MLCYANQNKDGMSHLFVCRSETEVLHQMEKWADFPLLCWRFSFEAVSVVPVSHLYLFFSVFSRIKHFQETTGQEVMEDWVSSWEVWFPQVKSCGGSGRGAVSAHGDCRALWTPSVQSIWDSCRAAGRDSILFRLIPIRWNLARNWGLAKKGMHQLSCTDIRCRSEKGLNPLHLERGQVKTRTPCRYYPTQALNGAHLILGWEDRVKCGSRGGKVLPSKGRKHHSQNSEKSEN